MLTGRLIPLAKLDDARLAARVGAGDAAAFSALYDRHHASLLAFCRHMVGNRHDAEDALQQTFIRAHRAMLRGDRPDEPRAWLFAIARNRCRTLLSSRPDTVGDDEQLECACVDGLSAQVQQRAELRELLADMSKLPEDQRAALLLTELRGFSHDQIARVIGCPAQKVKALVFQARTHLLAEREARDTECVKIREQLAVARGAELRRGLLRRHLRRCDPCRAYSVAVAGQRMELAGLMTVLPTSGLKAAVLGAAGIAGAEGAAGGAGGAVGLAGGGYAASTGGVAAKLALVKVAAVLAVGGVAAGGATAVVDRDSEADRVAATRHASPRAPASVTTSAVTSGSAIAAVTPARKHRSARRRARAGTRARARIRRLARIRRSGNAATRPGAGARVGAPRARAAAERRAKLRRRRAERRTVAGTSPPSGTQAAPSTGSRTGSARADRRAGAVRADRRTPRRRPPPQVDPAP